MGSNNTNAGIAMGMGMGIGGGMGSGQAASGAVGVGAGAGGAGGMMPAAGKAPPTSLGPEDSHTSGGDRGSGGAGAGDGGIRYSAPRAATNLAHAIAVYGGGKF